MTVKDAYVSLQQQHVEKIVAEVLRRVASAKTASDTDEKASAHSAGGHGEDGIFNSLEEALDAAHAAFPRIRTLAVRAL